MAYQQLGKQQLIKLQDQEFSYAIMCQLLNSLERYALGNEEDRKYEGHDYFNSVATKKNSS